MNKLKTGMIVLLTLAVLAAGSFFPKIISLVQDLNNSGEASSTPITPVRLEITKEITPLGRLVMLSRSEGSIRLTEDKTNMTEEAVMDAVRKGLQPYIDTQLIVYSGNEVMLQPHLLQVPDMPELQGVVWFVNITCEPAYFSALDLIVDDKTGHILHIEYTHEDGINAMPSNETLTILAEIFFSSLDIDYSDQLKNANTEHAYDDINAAKRYSFSDPQYGDVFVDFYIYSGGFYTECSSF